MVEMNNKLVILDSDGVLLNWEYAFNLWIQDLGLVVVPGTEKVYDLSIKYGITKANCRNLVKKFNHSVSIGYLPAMRDAVYNITKLAEEGYRFIVISSLSTDDDPGRLRTQNLKKVFGDVFDRFIYLDTGDDKDDALSEFQDSNLFWIEDKIENAEAGLKAGLRPILLAHGHNFEYNNLMIPVKKNWNEIYNYIKEQDANCN